MVKITNYLMKQKVNKSKLWALVCNKIGYTIHRLHVLSVINILIDEMIKELKSGKEIKIKNFGVVQLNILKPKKIRSVATNNIKFVKRTKSLRFRLARRLAKFLSRKSIEEMKKSVDICEENQEQ